MACALEEIHFGPIKVWSRLADLGKPGTQLEVLSISNHEVSPENKLQKRFERATSSRYCAEYFNGLACRRLRARRSIERSSIALMLQTYTNIPMIFGVGALKSHCLPMWREAANNDATLRMLLGGQKSKLHDKP